MDLAPLIGAGGGLGILAAVIIYLLSSNRADRQDYREAVREERTRADEAETKLDVLQAVIDEARAARRAAEDRAALAERELAHHRAEGPT